MDPCRTSRTASQTPSKRCPTAPNHSEKACRRKDVSEEQHYYAPIDPPTDRYPSPRPHSTNPTSPGAWTIVPPSPNRPSYSFPATWPTALQDTNTALSRVGAATTAYAQAIASSGLGKAGMSIGSAVVASACKGVDAICDRVTTATAKMSKGKRSGKNKGKRKAGIRESGNGDEEGIFEDERGMFLLSTSEAHAQMREDELDEDELHSTGVVVEPMRALYTGQALNYERERREHGGWVRAGVRGVGSGDGKRNDDGEVRLFQFDG